MVAYDRNTHAPDPLDALPYSPNAAFNSWGKDHDCLPGTRRAVLDDIRTWIDGEDKQHIFWLTGWAGTGKSTIARTVAREYYDKDRVVMSYFFSRGGGDTGTATKLVATIAKQLAHKSPKFKFQLEAALKQDGGIIHRVLKDQWQELIAVPLSKLDEGSLPKPPIIVVDALDECDTEASIRQVLQLLADTRKFDRLLPRILVTSRPDVPIKEELSRFLPTGHCLRLQDISESTVDEDISCFFKNRLAAIRPEEQVIAQLVEKAAGLFIWAATACRFIGKGPSAEKRLDIILASSVSTTTLNEYVNGPYIAPLREVIILLLWNASILYFWTFVSCGFVREGLIFKQWLYAFLTSNTLTPDGHLDRMYLTILNRSLNPDPSPDSIPPTLQEIRDLSNIARDVLGTVVVLFSLPPVQSIYMLLWPIKTKKGESIPTEEKEAERKRNAANRLLGNLTALIEAPDDETRNIRLHHPSFRDFLLSKRRCYDTYFWVDQTEMHLRTANRCLQLISDPNILKQDICGLHKPGILRTEIDSQIIDEHLPAEVKYACRYWVHHVQLSQIRIQDGHPVHDFLQKQFLYWLEALSLIGEVSESISMITSLQSCLEVSYGLCCYGIYL